MSTPALLFCDPEVGSIKIAALTLLDRLVVAAHRAGCAPITIVCDGSLPSLKRSHALGIETHVVTDTSSVSKLSLIATANVLVQTHDLIRVIARKGRLITGDGMALPVGVVSRLSKPTTAALDEAPNVMAEGVAVLVRDPHSTRDAEKLLWDSLSSATDGLVDTYFNRPLGRPLSKLLIHTPVSPNQVSVFATLVGVFSAWYFTLGLYRAALIGAVLFQISAIIDCIDGDLARVVFKESRIGKWLDIVGDQVVHISLFIGIGIGLARAGLDVPVITLTLSASIGVVISFVVVVREMLQPEEQRSSRLQRLLDVTTNRDFSVLLLVLVVANKMELFLWMTGIGVHLFWITAVVVQLQSHAAPAEIKEIHENDA